MRVILTANASNPLPLWERVGATIFVFLTLLITPALALSGEAQVPRTIIALYDQKVTSNIQSSLAHNLAEMPLNHLGLKLEYYDVNEPLPNIKDRADVRGVISWFNTETRIDDTEAYLKWAAAAIDAGKKYVVMGNPAFYENSKKEPTSINTINYFLKKLGLSTNLQWINFTYKTNLTYINPNLFLPGQKLSTKSAYLMLSTTDSSTNVHLTGETGVTSPLVVTNQRGGYVADGYGYAYHEGISEEIRQWVLNPFTFFSLAFDTKDMPKPDTTTLAGRRIFYSHIDGDGWNNYTQIEEYKKDPILSSQVIMEKVAKAYPELPLSLTVIAADIDPNWVALKTSRKIAQEFFALPNVEAGTHTYSHPFYWKFFADGNWQKEKPYLNRYHSATWEKKGKFNTASSSKQHTHSHSKKTDELSTNYTTPRAYAKEPFSIEKEISGSVKELTSLLPAGKKVELLTWPGDCSPWEKAIALTRQAGLGNINGGDSRFDPEYPSYASVSPLGRPVGSEQQIYASTSNENTYTSLWSGRFFGQKYLKRTNHNTETPIRIKPFNIYYHLYAGEKQASLNAVIENVDDASKSSLAPITTRQFTDIANGFYSTRIVPIAAKRWRITNRGSLNTIRFDQAMFDTVDFANAEGVIGQRHFQGSLYIYLDKKVEEPVIALKAMPKITHETEENIPYLVESRWQIEGLVREKRSFSFTAKGFGKGEMVWQVPKDGDYKIVNGNQELVTTASDHLLRVIVPEAGMVTISSL